jgi:hypothetical protein
MILVRQVNSKQNNMPICKNCDEEQLKKMQLIYEDDKYRVFYEIQVVKKLVV